jgi:hypothetical protein
MGAADRLFNRLPGQIVGDFIPGIVVTFIFRRIAASSMNNQFRHPLLDFVGDIEGDDLEMLLQNGNRQLTVDQLLSLGR